MHYDKELHVRVCWCSHAWSVMSCQVMYQSHYSYFPYQRAASHPNTDTKQGIVDTADTDTAAAQADR